MAIKVGPVQNLGITAGQMRHMLAGASPGVGIPDSGDLTCSAGSGLTTTVSAGRYRVRNYYGGADNGIYEVLVDAPVTLTHDANGGVTRVDQIVLTIKDAVDLIGSPDSAAIEIVKGSTAGGGNLDTRATATSLNANQYLLYDVLIESTDTTSSAFTYRDRRAVAIPGIIPAAVSGFDSVAMQFVNGVAAGGTQLASTATTNYQAAVLTYLPAPITATKIRWWYGQGGTAGTGNYVIAIFDASGRKIIDTGSIAFTGAANTYQVRSETITSTRFEAGLYYVFFGHAMATTSATATTLGIPATISGGSNGSVGGIAGFAKYATTGGVTVPTTILAMTNVQATNNTTTPNSTTNVSVPQITLSTT